MNNGNHVVGGQTQPQMMLGMSAGGVPVLAQSQQRQMMMQTTMQHGGMMQTTMQHGSTAYQYQQMDCPWSVNHTFRVCSEGEESMFIGQARLLDRNAFTSVSMAVEHLNYGTLSCPEGFCVVF